jgi:hypothetical protein
MQESMDAVVPAEVEQFVQTFAEVKNYANGVKPSFKIKKGKQRAKKFATRATASGVYETFRLDADTIDVNTLAIGDAAYIDFERFLSGDEDWADYMEALMAGILHRIYVEIFDCLIAQSTVENLQKYNMYEVDSNYHQENFLALVNKVNNYGKAIVVACPEFINAMGPDAIVPAVSGAQAVYHPDDIDAIHNLGRIKLFRGTPVVELRQSFLDENNAQVMIHPQFAYVLPSGKEKVVKIAMEGGTQMYDVTNPDQSIEIHTYRKIGVGILAFNNWGIYKNTSIDASNWYDSSLGL